MSAEKHSAELKRDDSNEKGEVVANAEPLDAHYDPSYVARVIRRVDWRTLPLLGLLYSIALIDRTNLAVARISGMDSDLKLRVGERYSIASMIYFPPYIILQLPSNIMLRWLGAQMWMTICVVGWGAAQIGMAFVPNWGLLCLTRVLLGIFEAGFFPALAFIVQTWYKREEVQKRIAGFYLISIIFGGFSAILAYAFQLLKGKGDLNGWQWIFLIEGIVTVVLGIATWFFIPDFPDKNRFLNADDTKMIMDRVEADRADSIPDPMNITVIIKHFKDPLLWGFALMFMASTMPAYAIGFFITTLLIGMGFNLKEALLLVAPPYIAAAMSCFFFAWLSDKTRMRAPWLAAQNIIVIIGLMVCAYAKQNGARYFGIFFINMGASGCVPGVIAYNANNITSHSKRSVSTAIVIAFGGIGGIFATLVYRESDAKKDGNRYIPGIWATMACQFLMLILLAIHSYVFRRRNQLAREGKRINEETPGFLYII